MREETAPDERCGNCKFQWPVMEDLTIIECRGAPPTPAVVGMTPAGPQIALLRARLPKAEKACALWKLRPARIIV